VSFVAAQPDLFAAAAGAPQIVAQSGAAATPTTGVVPAVADGVSALTAARFATHAQRYPASCAHAAATHEAFVQTLAANAITAG
jgi:hypothetical protein